MSAEELRWLNEWVRSWPVQATVAALLLVLVGIAFARSTRTFGEGQERTRFRVAVALLGVLLVLQAALTVAAGRMVVPVGLQVVEVLWLFALWLYYFFRLVTRQRKGRGDAETRRRGVALDTAIDRFGRERRAAPVRRDGAPPGPPGPPAQGAP